MSMLAEPRRRRRVGPNPRGKFFTEDEDNRGRSMLQKMGWNKGDGLGALRQGIVEPIKPKIQTDARGLGFDVKSDPWINHCEDFNEILKNLQAAHGTNKKEERDEPLATARFGFGFNQEETKSEKREHVDLEAKSKKSKSRIHYHKFIKGKDLSKIKNKDWSCIFGKAVESSVVEVKSGAAKAGEVRDYGPYESGQFINCGSYQEYFQAKRSKLCDSDKK